MTSLILAPTERVVWQGDRQHNLCSHTLGLVTVLGCLVVGAAFSTMIDGFAYKAVTAVGCLLIVVSAVTHLTRLPKTFVLTNHRIVELDRDGKCAWRDGVYLARNQDANIRRGICGSTVTINTVQMDHGDPETVQVGPLHQTDATQLADLLPTIALEAQAW